MYQAPKNPLAIEKIETYFERLPAHTQERIVEMARRPKDPLRLPRHEGISFIRVVLWGLLGLSFLPGFLAPWLFIVCLSISALAGAIGLLLVEHWAPHLPAFWYLHPQCLVGVCEEIVEAFPWAGLKHAIGTGYWLQLSFPEKTVVISCPNGDAQDYAALAAQYAQNPLTELQEEDLF